MAGVMMVVVAGGTQRHFMSVSIITIILIANGVVAPVRMDSFPVVKACHTNRIKRQPDIAHSQIKILSADNADIFVTVPDVSIGDAYIHCDCRRRCRRNDHGCNRWTNLHDHRRA